MVYVVFLKKNQDDPGSGQVKQSIFLRKKNAWALLNMETRHRLAPNFASSFS